MKVLIIEDIVYRQNYLKDLIEMEEVHCVQRADDGLELLAKNNYDLVLLDHEVV